MATVQVMGILNVTPDSFSDGGHHNELSSALEQARLLIDSGADILDIGGESTRPFADPVNTEEELHRTIPVIQGIRTFSNIPISIDTSKAAVARKAISVGADIINDVTAFRKDPLMIEVAKETKVPIIIMHMQNNPENMQLKPEYEDVVGDIMVFFRERLDWLKSEGISLDKVTIDPGIGFGKTYDHNVSILKHLDRFNELSQPILLGHSRKRFLGEMTGKETDDRDFATAVISALAVKQKIAMVRVHDVSSTKEALHIAHSIELAQ